MSTQSERGRTVAGAEAPGGPVGAPQSQKTTEKRHRITRGERFLLRRRDIRVRYNLKLRVGLCLYPVSLLV